MSNPLFTNQREKAGSQTLSKYSYQYHWALEKAVVLHQNGAEYAIFVEYHEDVIQSTSLDKTKAEFEFNQIKTDASGFSVKKLTERKKSKSVLAKLLEGTQNKAYSTRITSINLVSVNGFNFTLKNPILRCQIITIYDIDGQDIKKLTDEIQKEIANCVLPTSLNFVVPTLKEENHQRVLIGEISELISRLFPNSNYDSTQIYRLLIDDLFRKGQDSFDYRNWDDAINKKAITSGLVSETINAFTSHKGDGEIESQFIEIAKELGYKAIERKLIDKAFHRYKNRAFGSRSPQQLKTSLFLKDSITRNMHKSNNEIRELINLVYKDIQASPPPDLIEKNDSIGAIIYEFITLK